MKKLLSMLLVLMLMSVSVAIAEDIAPENQRVEDVEMGYAYEIPGDWMVISSETLGSLIDVIADMSDLFGEENIAALQQQMQMIVDMGMSMTMSGDFTANVGVIVQDGEGLTTQMLLENKEAFLAEYAAYAQLGAEITVDGVLATIGEREYFCICLTMAEQSIEQFMFVENKVLYQITLTNCSEEASLLILSSFEVL